MKKRNNNKQTPLPKQELPASPDINNPSKVTAPLEEIQKRAYAIFETRGGASGHELDDWLLAEAEIRTELTLASSNGPQLGQGN
jgi:DUF2934 family protein